MSKFRIYKTSLCTVTLLYVMFYEIFSNVPKFTTIMTSIPCVVIPTKYFFNNLFYSIPFVLSCILKICVLVCFNQNIYLQNLIYVCTHFPYDHDYCNCNTFHWILICHCSKSCLIYVLSFHNDYMEAFCSFEILVEMIHLLLCILIQLCLCVFTCSVSMLIATITLSIEFFFSIALAFVWCMTYLTTMIASRSFFFWAPC